MKKTVFKYEETERYLVIDGNEYEIPARTAELERRIREHDSRIPEMTEYESNYSMLEILFGIEAAEKMFPDKDKTNLDKLFKCTQTAIKLFMSEYESIKNGFDI